MPTLSLQSAAVHTALAALLVIGPAQAGTPDVRFTSPGQLVQEVDGLVTMTVELSAIHGLDVVVPFQVSGTATAGSDFFAPPSPVVIPAGFLTADLDFVVVDDNFSEPRETVIVTLGTPANATLGTPAVHVVGILDNDTAIDVFTPVIPGLRVEPQAIVFDTTRATESSAPVVITLTNEHTQPIALRGAVVSGEDAADFEVLLPPLPHSIGPGQSTTVDVSFLPGSSGPKDASIAIHQSPAGVPVALVSVSGMAIGALGEELRVNVGGADFMDTAGDLWNGDYGATGASLIVTSALPGAQIFDTEDDELYRKARFGVDFGFAYDLPDGPYDMRLHFVEFNTSAVPGMHVFDVRAEGALVVDDLDVFAVSGIRRAHVEGPFRVVIADGRLDIELEASSGLAVIAAIELGAAPALMADPTQLDFLTVDQSTHQDLEITLTNAGLLPVTIDSLAFVMPGGAPSASDFTVEIGGATYAGSAGTISYPIALTIPAGEDTQAIVSFAPTEHEDHAFTLRFTGDFEPLEVPVIGTGGADAGWGFLHPIVGAPQLIIDYDGDLVETVQLTGSPSHTHEPGHDLALFEWFEAGLLFSNEPDPLLSVGLGDTPITLTTYDDNEPPASASESKTLSVYPADAVPGILVQYYGYQGDPALLLDAVPGQADFVERIERTRVIASDGMVGGSNFDTQVMVRLVADFEVQASAAYAFFPTGGSGHRLEVDGVLYTQAVVLQPGPHAIDLRFAVDDLFDLPLALTVTIDGQTAVGFDNGFTHDQLGVVPTIHDMTPVGSQLGGNLISIQGFGYFPQPDVVLHWGSQEFAAQDFAGWTPTEVRFISPPGQGSIQVRIETPAGQSVAREFTYSVDGPVPIEFTHLAPETLAVTSPTTGDWGPDGRFYVGQLNGEITAVIYDDNYHVVDVQTYVGVSNLTNPDITGIAFNPYDPYDPYDPGVPVRVYVTHSLHFQNGIDDFSGPSAYTGQLSVLTGPDFAEPEAVITQLPTSNYDHGVNGITFDNNGDLFLTVGGNTNAGVAWQDFGGIGESPLSGAILEAHLSRPDFEGALSYVETATGIPNDDQGSGEIVSLEPGSHVDVFAAGMRNPYDLLLSTWGYLYCTDNGPNGGYGPASTGPDTDSGYPQPWAPDELNLVEFGNYYGHPNRNRGRIDPRQNIYHQNNWDSVPGVYTQGISELPPSSDGIAEYRANTFGGAMRGQLLVQKYRFRPQRVVLNEDQRSVFHVWDNMYTDAQGLDIQTGPGGAILVVDYARQRLEVLVPNDAAALGMGVYDVHPWRAPASGGSQFTLGGFGFGTMEETTVTIGGVPAVLTRVSPTRIEGIVPAHPTQAAPPTGLVPIEVRVGPTTSVLPDAFRYLFPQPGVEPGIWRAGEPLPSPLGGVSTGVVDGRLIVVGEGVEGAKTFAYDIAGDVWTDQLAQRPHPGRRHAAVVVDGELYLFGGLGGAEGKVQIYDPASDTWRAGLDMPWAAGAAMAAVIEGEVFVVGGIIGGQPVANAAVYRPTADSWTIHVPLPTPVSHAAAGTDGQRLYVFGGRQDGEDPGTPLALVQVYDPVSSVWTTSADPGEPLLPLPAGRADTGRAVWYRGELYLFGGETGATDTVFATVFAYDPELDSWREEAPMLTPRHGTDPVLYQGRLFVVGGGAQVGISQADALEFFSRL